MSWRDLLPPLQLLAAPCREISRLISESMDRPLTRPERVAVWTHTLYCRACHRFGKQSRLIRSLLVLWVSSLMDGPADAAAGPTLPAEVRESIQRAIRRHA